MTRAIPAGRIGASAVTILFYDGRSWTVQESGVNGNLKGVFALDLNNVWAVGEKGTVLFCDAGEDPITWSPEPCGEPFDKFNGIGGVQASTGDVSVWVVGDNGKIFYFDGATWTAQNAATEEDLNDVSALSVEKAWAVGDSGTIIKYQGDAAHGWKKVENPGVSSDISLNSISVMNSENIWAVGTEETIVFYDGSEWSIQYSGPSDRTYCDVKSLGMNNVWVASSNMPLRTGEILHYTGEAWSTDHYSRDVAVLGISGVGGKQVYAVCKNGTILQREADVEYDPKWKLLKDHGSSFKPVARPSDYSPKAWGEDFIADNWLIGGKFPYPFDGEIPVDVLYRNVFSLPFLAYMPKCLMKDAKGDFYLIENALRTDVDTYLRAYFK